jgi:hypothetical protein
MTASLLLIFRNKIITERLKRIENIAAANIGFCASWADAVTISICNSVQFLFGLDGILFPNLDKALPAERHAIEHSNNLK